VKILLAIFFQKAKFMKDYQKHYFLLGKKTQKMNANLKKEVMKNQPKHQGLVPKWASGIKQVLWRVPLMVLKILFSTTLKGYLMFKIQSLNAYTKCQ